MIIGICGFKSSGKDTLAEFLIKDYGFKKLSFASALKDIVAINKEEVFKPYKDLCATIANVISENNASYKFPKSLSTTLIEASHHQQFFAENLPRLTDKNAKNKTDFAAKFLSDMIFKVLGI